MNVVISVLIFITFTCVITYTLSFLSNEVISKSNENSEQIYEERKKGINEDEIVSFCNKEDAICKYGYKKYEDLVKTIDNYVQRYVSLFLITSNLRNHEVKDLNEEITIDLEISISGEDLTYLQGFSKSSKDSSYPKNFSKLDAIFSKIARLKERSFAERALKSSKSFFSSFDFLQAVSGPNIYMFSSFLLTILMSWIVHYFIFHKSFYLFLGLIMNGLMFWESINEYWKRLKDINAEIFVNSLGGIPKECDRSNLRWYHKLKHYISEDPCLQYYKNINKDPREEVSIFKCIIDTYSNYLIRTPLKLFGTLTRDITEEISALWPKPFRYFINFTYIPFFAIVLALFVLVLFRKRLKLSFFGAAVEIGETQRVLVNERPQLTSSQTPKVICIGRKLKPWTKSRFPKRLECSVSRQKKLFLKYSKSESELPALDEQHCNNSYEKLINTETKHD